MMDSNWMALYAAIVNPILTAEEALRKMGVRPQKESKSEKYARSIEKTLGMVAMKKKGKTLQEIGMSYGVTAGAVCRRIKEYKINGQGDETRWKSKGKIS